jgi:hypothetical protein
LPAHRPLAQLLVEAIGPRLAAIAVRQRGDAIDPIAGQQAAHLTQ